MSKISDYIPDWLTYRPKMAGMWHFDSDCTPPRWLRYGAGGILAAVAHRDNSRYAVTFMSPRGDIERRQTFEGPLEQVHQIVDAVLAMEGV